jgi:predicted flap endonuclease-1-like 5' DNA nuclease
MSSRQTVDSFFFPALMAVATGLVAFGLAITFGDWNLTPAVGVSALVGAVVGAFLFVAFTGGTPSGFEPRPVTVPASSLAAPLPAPPAPSRPAAKAVAKPGTAPKPVPVSSAPSKPQGLTAARGGKPDDLKLIVGVGPKLEALLHRLGYFHFDQIANWTAAEIAWVDDNLEGFKGRVTRDDWVAQAKAFAAKRG